jgi:hypothetical protein
VSRRWGLRRSSAPTITQPHSAGCAELWDNTGKLIGSFSAVTVANPDPEDESKYKRLKSTATFNPEDTATPGLATITARAGGRSATASIEIVQ